MAPDGRGRKTEKTGKRARESSGGRMRATMTAIPKPSARFAVKVVPGSSRDQIVGWLGDTLKIKVAAPPFSAAVNTLP